MFFHPTIWISPPEWCVCRTTIDTLSNVMVTYWIIWWRWCHWRWWWRWLRWWWRSWCWIWRPVAMILCPVATVVVIRELYIRILVIIRELEIRIFVIICVITYRIHGRNVRMSPWSAQCHHSALEDVSYVCCLRFLALMKLATSLDRDNVALAESFSDLAWW